MLAVLDRGRLQSVVQHAEGQSVLPEDPVKAVWRVEGLEPEVGRVGVPAHSQQVKVVVTDPGHLRQQKGSVAVLKTF